jgi:hypothetical protein
MSQRDATRLVRDLRRYFAANDLPFTVEMRGSHWHVLRANGSSVRNFGATPSDNHFRANAISQLRRAGVIDRDFR